MELAGRRVVVEAQSCDVAGRQTERVERRAAAVAAAVAVFRGRRRRLAGGGGGGGGGVLLGAGGQRASPQFEAGAALGEQDVQSRRHAHRVDDDDGHAGRRVPPTRRRPGAGEVQTSGARTDVDERLAAAVEEVDLEEFGVRQHRAALSLTAAAAAALATGSS